MSIFLKTCYGMSKISLKLTLVGSVFFKACKHAGSMLACPKKENMPRVIWPFFFFCSSKIWYPLKFLKVQFCLDLTSFRRWFSKNFGRFFDLLVFFLLINLKKIFFSMSIFLKTCYGISNISLKLTLLVGFINFLFI